MEEYDSKQDNAWMWSTSVMIWKYGRMEWDDGLGMFEMLEMN